MQKLEICDEVVCAEPEIVMENTMTLAKAHVVLEKSYFFDKKDLPKFSKRKVYLVKGDIVELQDYYSDGNVAYFKVIYSGSKKTIGWILEESIALDN